MYFCSRNGLLIWKILCYKWLCWSEYFCDRVQETTDITDLLVNGNNLALISPRRYGKTDLLRHCFAQEKVKADYYTFIVDIYATKSLADMVNKLGKSILEELKPKGKRSWSAFLNVLSSVKAGVEYDAMGQPSWNLSLGQIQNPSNTLDEIFIICSMPTSLVWWPLMNFSRY